MFRIKMYGIVGELEDIYFSKTKDGAYEIFSSEENRTKFSKMEIWDDEKRLDDGVWTNEDTVFDLSFVPEELKDITKQFAERSLKIKDLEKEVKEEKKKLAILDKALRDGMLNSSTRGIINEYGKFEIKPKISASKRYDDTVEMIKQIKLENFKPLTDLIAETINASSVSALARKYANGEKPEEEKEIFEKFYNINNYETIKFYEPKGGKK